MTDDRRPPDDFPAERLIREGHQGLVETFREFAHDLDEAADRRPEPEVLRAMIAFLRQGLLPFAHWEEQQLDGCPGIADETAFEHAFLNAEIDTLAAAVADLDAAEEQNPAVLRIRRCLHRIEAVLELHVQKAEDREDSATAWETIADDRAPAEPASSALREMTSEEAHRTLRRNEWGIFCTVGGGSPYGVPVSYGFDGQFLYMASGPGRKRQNLETEAAVCLTVAEVKDGDHWSSVVVTGEALPVSGLRDRLRALDAIRRQRATVGTPSPADLARIARSTVFRITPREITGRVRG